MSREILARKGTIRTYTDVDGDRRRLVSEGRDAWRLEDGSIVHIFHIQRQRYKQYAGKLYKHKWHLWNPWDFPRDLEETNPLP